MTVSNAQSEIGLQEDVLVIGCLSALSGRSGFWKPTMSLERQSVAGDGFDYKAPTLSAILAASSRLTPRTALPSLRRHATCRPSMVHGAPARGAQGAQ